MNLIDLKYTQAECVCVCVLCMSVPIERLTGGEDNFISTTETVAIEFQCWLLVFFFCQFRIHLWIWMSVRIFFPVSRCEQIFVIFVEIECDWIMRVGFFFSVSFLPSWWSMIFSLRQFSVGKFWYFFILLNTKEMAQQAR